MKAGWPVRQVARELGNPDCVVRRCWNLWSRELSFTRTQAQDALDRLVVEKTTPSKEMHVYN
ncbi:UNVERIFIED_CONTAM: hypothetical protein NCL1_47981 [Trichonephila clavipes]